MSRLTVTFPIIFLVAISILFGCSSDDDKYPDGIYSNFRYDLVTFSGITGDQATFSYVPRSDDSATITLTAQKGFSTDGLTAGKRVLLRYSPQAGTAFSGTQPIYAYFYNSIISDTLRAYRSDVPVSSFSMHPVKMRSAWRTGDYINLHCQVEYTGKARVFMLVLDPSTANADTVHCYLVHDIRTDTAYFWRNCYASFHVGKFWNKPSCRTLRLHVNNAVNSQENCFDFSK